MDARNSSSRALVAKTIHMFSLSTSTVAVMQREDRPWQCPALRLTVVVALHVEKLQETSICGRGEVEAATTVLLHRKTSMSDGSRTAKGLLGTTLRADSTKDPRCKGLHAVS